MQLSDHFLSTQSPELLSTHHVLWLKPMPPASKPAPRQCRFPIREARLAAATNLGLQRLPIFHLCISQSLTLPPVSLNRFISFALVLLLHGCALAGNLAPEPCALAGAD